jgi:long-chain fatty acid transport protein
LGEYILVTAGFPRSSRLKIVLLRLTAGAFACFAFVALAVLPAAAGGLSLYEIGTSDVGLASAGWAARAQDPATLLKNPAGMSLLQGNQFQGGAQLLHASIGFSPGQGTTVDGNDGGNPVGTLPALSLFYVHGISDDVKVGLGLFSNFGLGMNYNSGWVGRYYALDNTLIGVTVMPGLSYRINDQWSIGIAANVMYGYLNYTAAINNRPFVGAPDGQVQVKDNTWGAGGNIGVLYEPVKGTRFGVTYYSQVKLNFSDTPTYTGLSGPLGTFLQNRGLLNQQLDLGVTVPQSVMVSSYHEFTDRWAMMLDFGWQEWSQFGKADVALTGNTINASATTSLNYQDTYHVALGNRYRLNQTWLLNTGFAWDSSMIKTQNFTVTVPVGDVFRFGLGAEWQASPGLNVAFSYELAYGGTMPVNQNRGPLAGAVVGEFPGTYTNFFQVSFIWGSTPAQTRA